MKVLAALSGGVDSSVAAARLVAAGHEVVGIHLALSSQPQTLRTGARGCCSLEDSGDARRVADKLGIPFYVWDFSERFRHDVIEDFVDTYSRGETPNPCLRCNERIKFEALLERGLALGYDAVATGHYARIDENGCLRRGIDEAKDQSYVLGVLTPFQLQHSLFPIGDTRKPDIRQEAADWGFSVASKPDSTDICFIPDGNTQQFLTLRLGEQTGPIVDLVSGEVVATHTGIHRFTIGQRKGIGLPGPLPDGQPRYVVRIDPQSQTVFIGHRDHLRTVRLVGWPAVWHDPLMQEWQEHTAHGDNDPRFSPRRCEVQLRAHGRPVPCTVSLDNNRVSVELDEPAYGMAAGQSAVFYDPSPQGDRVIGSATIHLTEHAQGHTE